MEGKFQFENFTTFCEGKTGKQKPAHSVTENGEENQMENFCGNAETEVEVSVIGGRSESDASELSWNVETVLHDRGSSTT